VSDQPFERSESTNGSTSYQVVARRYRPQTLDDLVGQDHVVAAIRNAIRLNRITHAYLFTGTRGVGKTSMARIFAKCLNCVNGPTDKPCNECDICRSIAVGQDVDVIEIDGASNNGVEAVRELRANVSLRPSRARFKIYYIDEVHMLSTGAFNALLKTLEEPPEHVKFFFATTESHKIPITVLSRCQRFDFAGISPDSIVNTLAEICQKEGVDVENDALWTVARRAGGSMRDAQSLLERLLVHTEGQLSDEKTREILGLASDDRMLEMLEAVVAHDLARVLLLVDSAINVGVQPGDLVSGLLELLRDAMVQASGSTTPLIAVGSRQKPRLESMSRDWGLDSILAAMQILAETRAKMKGNPQGRLLAELGLARVARLDKLADLADVVAQIKAGGGPLTAASRPSAGATATSVTTQRISASPSSSSAISASVASSTGSVSPVVQKPETVVSAMDRRHEPVVAVTEVYRDDPPPTGSAPISRTSVPAGDDRKQTDLPSLERIQGRWSEFVGKLGMRYGTVIAGYPPAGFAADGSLLCRVPTTFDTLVATLQPEADEEKIGKAAREVFGKSIKLKIELSAEAKSNARTEADADARWTALEETPIIQHFVNLMQARRFWMDKD
jgi:DNA polymerase-3 subunit gamma/tau